MSKAKGRLSAFASDDSYGLDKREYFAAAALCIIPTRGADGYPRLASAIAEDAFMIADALCEVSQR